MQSPQRSLLVPSIRLFKFTSIFLVCSTSTFACSSADTGEPSGNGAVGDGDIGSGGAGQAPGSGGGPGAGGGTGTGGVLDPGSGGLGSGGAGTSGGAPGAGGETTGSGGDTGTGGGAPGGTPGAGGETAGTGGDTGAGGGGNHAPRSLGFVGCSMSDNVAAGYAAVGGMRMWPSTPAYWGQVVQDWANPSDPVWDAFDDHVDEFGVPTAVWIMVCIFNPPGVQLEEMRDIVGLVRERAPDATIYTTGQPFYAPGAECTIAGNDGPQVTDDMAQEMANDSSLTDVHYVGMFGPLTAAMKEDVCHANTAGQELLGEQAVEFFGE